MTNDASLNAGSLLVSYGEEAAAALLDLRPSTLAAWRSRKQGPAYVRVGGAIRYLHRDLEAFVMAGRVEPAAESA